MEKSTEFDPLLRPEKAAEYVGLAISTLYTKSQAGEIPSVKLGRALRFRLSALNAWIAQQEASTLRPASDAELAS